MKYLRQIIKTTIQEFFSKNNNYLGDMIRNYYNDKKISGSKEIEFQNLVTFGLKYDENFVEKLTDFERRIWLKLQDSDFDNEKINLPIVNIPIENITFSQYDISIEKIEKKKFKSGLPIFIKKNNTIYIISGNHRLFFQLIKENKNKITGYIKDFDK